MVIDDVLSMFQGRVIARSGEELFSGSPELVAELATLKSKLTPEVFALKALVAATLRPEDFRWEPFECSNPVMVAAELKYSARYIWGWPYRTDKPTPQSR